ncbi:MAG: serine/threonine-protein kinase [Lapillicoccus sp.]
MTHLGRYRLVERLGAGAFATVWLARDDELDVSVAIKVLADNWSSNADIRERFLAEARLLRRISDRRVVRVHDIGAAEDQPYFVMDYVAGGTLAELLDHPPVPAEAIHLGAQTAYAVQVLHDHDVVHRDVKPSNLLLDHQDPRDGTGAPTVLVTDLGMAKSLAEASGLTVTAGTPSYMAPEQVQGSDGFDARADVYAVAAVTHALLTGRPPFPVHSLTDVLTRDPALDPVPIAVALGLPRAVDDLLAAALSMDPGRRPDTARAFGDALRRAATTQVDDTVVESPMPDLPSEPPEPSEALELSEPSGLSQPPESPVAWSSVRVAGLALLAFVVFGLGTYAALTLR